MNGLKTIRLRTNPAPARRRKRIVKKGTGENLRRPIKRRKALRRRRIAGGEKFIIQGFGRGPKGLPRFYYYTAAGKWFSGRVRAKRYDTSALAAAVLRTLAMPPKFSGAQIVPA